MKALAGIRKLNLTAIQININDTVAKVVPEETSSDVKCHAIASPPSL
jgi:hypothetical protein